MKLATLIQNTPLETSFPEYDIAFLTSDSRKVTANSLFAALKGVTFDGRQYIKEAIQKGATAILTDTFDDAQSFPQVAFFFS